MSNPTRIDPTPSEAIQMAWARLLRAHQVALGLVETRLKDAGLPALEWYDVLLELERQGPLRPRQLQAELLLPQYNLSRLLERMVDAGLLERRPCPDDARGHLVAPTRRGRGVRRRMWPVYAAAIGEAVGERVSEREAAQLAELLGRIAGPRRT
ncbi:MarR family transcriptional regulator [Phenylobacterium sp.]|jgi:DNA-binding MarR family transcriptional regulator|uniref:MarR family winged helix-turn-helix transcriptional regulator n=1 Tax=Phenylobacterium sp. TaxID=1871053 RepID=UPI002F946462